MSRKHQDTRYVKLRLKVKPRLMAQLPMPCPRCGKPMEKGQALDLGHISRAPEAAYMAENMRLEHRSCNRRDGQRITTGKRFKPKVGERMPGW